MATSESDDFESADEELDVRGMYSRRVTARIPTVVDSESDDDTEFAGVVQAPVKTNKALGPRSGTDAVAPENSPATLARNKSLERSTTDTKIEATVDQDSAGQVVQTCFQNEGEDKAKTDEEPIVAAVKDEPSSEKPSVESGASTRERTQRLKKPKEPKEMGIKKLGSKISTENVDKPALIAATTPDQIRQKALAEGKEVPLIEECWEGIEHIPAVDDIIKDAKPVQWDSAWDHPTKPANVQECWEGCETIDGMEIPEELKSNKKFKEVFTSDGWEGMDDNIQIPDELTELKIQPVLEKLSLVGQSQENTSGWGGWGNWGVSSLLNTASAGVSTLSSHVSHGLSLLEESIGVPDPAELAKEEHLVETETTDNEIKDVEETQSQSTFGFGNLISGVSSITKLVESTGTKVINGGLDTLETIGKKTMEVLQEGDPGLKKKRAFFMNETDKPILSQMLREAKEKAEVEEKTLEEREIARKVHFESLFDDYQGLVHLEALEMLSKQSNIKIQQRLMNLDADELNSLQETLEEVKELCDLGDENEEDEDHEKDLKQRLKDACKDLGIDVSCDKLLDIWEETRSYLTLSSSTDSPPLDREIFQHAVSTLARFTAFSVERFHKTAELLLIKEHRSTVNEADALVQLTQILSSQIGIVANLFSTHLNELAKTAEKPQSIHANITTIFLEAANASSYIQDAFKLLIPIVQVGAI
ncbi:protein FAM114A2 isoform X1 [Cephus cinctus]|uniref:Protein FAM114A2 isoform X1 n=1 Tax=Cephus cinctus TaxID=211228 RepID=A0AAJ7FI96_CEPCN|nr:protein FAM114A2 isoform X1 [Cephus cinctus]